uniref:Protein GPR107 n=1 Tax=Panagrolaimus sp. JU765 TaxID=591449 RepID=A0AC34QXP6_9BILA
MAKALNFTWIFLFFNVAVGTIHYLSLRDETRRNVALTKFGYDDGGTLQFSLSNFTVPDEVVSFKDTPENRQTDKYGLIGFTLSRGSAISEGVRSNPHVCQLSNADQGLDALFFIFDFSKERLNVVRSGFITDIKFCSTLEECPTVYDMSEVNATRPPEDENVFKRILHKIVPPDNAIAWKDYIPLTSNGNKYNVQFAIRFFGTQRGEYQMFYHNCFNYKENGYNDRVAVDFAVSIVEMNRNSYLSAGDIIKPHIYLYLAFCFAIASITWMHKLCRSDYLSAGDIIKPHIYLYLAFCFAIASITWMHKLCRSDSNMVFRVHKLMAALIILKTMSNFLTDRDRNLFMIVLPLQIIDNIVMAIIDESEFAEQRYYFWVEVFMFLDLFCCVAIILPIIWSIRHLEEGARTDGKAAFNLEKLRLFRQFYVIVIAYIYLTRFAKFMFDQTLPFNLEWLSVAITETATLFFFCLVGYKFRPVRTNPYLKLSQDGRNDEDDDEAFALTPNGLYENVSKVQRITVNEVDEIPGTIGGYDSDDDENDTLLRTKGEVSIL